MPWNYSNHTWHADDYTLLPALREDNIHQAFVQQNTEKMQELFHGKFDVPTTEKFFEKASKQTNANGTKWVYELDSEGGSDNACICLLCEADVEGNVPVVLAIIVAVDDDPLYVARYEWKYRNEYVNKASLDYIAENCPDIPAGRWDRCVFSKTLTGLGSERGMEEDLVPFVWKDVTERNISEIAPKLYENTLRDLLSRGNILTNGTVSIQLDEYNLRKMLDKAEEIKKKWGTNKIVIDEQWGETTSYTGDKYHERITKMADVARRIMSGELVPDIFDKLPLKKDGTFKQGQTIVVFDGKISDAANYDYYTAGEKLCLGITTGDDYWSESKGSVAVSRNVARLAIITLNTTRKLYPLLDEDLNVQDIKTKTTYLKQDTIKPGSVYAEKSGTKQLYLGCAQDGYGDAYVYVRYTKKVEQMAKDAYDLRELCIKLAEADVTYSDRSNPRKFVSFVDEAKPEMKLSYEAIFGR